MKKFIPLFFVLVSLALSVAAYFTFPEQYASHWNIYGEANGFSERGITLFLFPVIQLFVWGLMYVIPRIDPKSKNIEKFSMEYENFILTFIGFFTFLHIITYLWNIGIQLNFSYFMIPAFSFLFYMIGGLLESAKMNYSIGIRTPWTLASEEVWDKTHKLGAKLVRGGAIISLLGLFSFKFGFYLFLIVTITPFFYLFVYSYVEYRKIEKE